METIPDPQQVRATCEFMLFLADTIGRTSQHFEDETFCSPEEAKILQTLSLHGPLMVKEIAQTMSGMNLSKLTRVLDSLETQGYITRSLNPQDRRSFLVASTEQGKILVGRLTQDLEKVAHGVLATLTPTERLVLVELFAKMQANWSDPSDQPDMPSMSP